MNDGAQAGTTVVTTYTRNDYSSTSSGTGCSSGKKKLKTQPQIGTCSITTVGGVAGAESCTWVNNGAATLSGSCLSSVTLPSPDPSVRVQSGTPVSTPGSIGGTSNNLADIAMYYYQTDLRTEALGNCGTAVAPATVGPLCENNVFIGGNDSNLQQHMTTFTLGLGASGWMNYSSSYLNDSTGDYVAVKLRSTASSTATPPVCSWKADGTSCTWPPPGIDGSGNGYIANIDDLWHAAVNGRGAYFSATNPASLASGLSNALAGINARKGSAAAAATSTLNPVAGNNFAYVASYTTVTWKGNLEARGINTDTGIVNENASWCVENVAAGTCASPSVVTAETEGDTTSYYCVTPDSVICTGGVMSGTDCKVPVATACTGTMNALVSDASDERIIKTANSAGTALIDFDAAYASANSTYFDATHIGTLSQWTSLTSAQQTAAAGTNLVNYLRGRYGYEDRTANLVANRLYRYREAVLGDALESQPAFIGAPVFSFPYPGYSEFKAAQASRVGTVFMGTNDGMMHGFAADTGIERWAYVPSMVIPNMWKLADKNYATLHTNYVNGSPATSDICVSGCADSATAVWKTILVAGLNAGGRGYYALDITVPGTPVLLWEFTITTGIGRVKDDDVGYSYGQPIITQKADGTWVVVVTSGYNNADTSRGDGKGYLFVLNAATGSIISKIATGVGSTTTPSGLARIAGWNEESVGNKVGYVYGGDLLGNLWRFNINDTATAAVVGTGSAMKFATLYSDTAGSSVQPITTTPILGKIAGKRVVFIGTGKYLEISDLTNTQKQTLYAIKDDDATATLVNPRNTLIQQTLTNDPSGQAIRTGSGNSVSFFTDAGWFIDFPDTGERVNIDSKLVMGALLVATIVPSNTACAPGGYGWLNVFDYATGTAINKTTNLVSLKYNSTIVGVNVIYIEGKPKVAVVTSSNPTPEINDNVEFPASASGFAGKRVTWRELIQ
jgi:type IV pilus assembly protein PilY1